MLAISTRNPLLIKLVVWILVTCAMPATGLKKVPLILGGVPVGQGDVYRIPFQVYIFTKKDGDDTKCGGSIINNFHILTAAHCVQGAAANQIEITAGTNYPSRLRGSADYSEQIRKGAQVYIHESFVLKTLINDIAIVRLDNPLTFSSQIQSISLPLPWEEFTGTGIVSGWGRTTEKGPTSDNLLFVEVPIIPYQACLKSYSNLRRDQMCAGAKGRDSCFGDSGGPLTCQRSSSREKVLCGIVSTGTGCGLPDYPGINTKVSSYITWIQDILAKSDRGTQYISNRNYINRNSRNNFNNWEPTRFDTRRCTYYEFQCTENSKCIPSNYKCNGYNDCPSGSDEYGCPSRWRSCSSYQFRCVENSKCVPSWFRCDNIRDCPFGSDEVGC